MFENITFFNKIYLFLLFLPFFIILFLLGKSFFKNSIFLKNKFNIINLLNYFFIFLSIFLIIILNSGFNIKNYLEIEKREGIDVVLVMDLSLSMLLDDIEPNRLEKSKSVLKNFIINSKSDRIGLVIYSGKPFIGVPLTFDYDFLIETIDNLSINSIDQTNPNLNGTSTGDALLMSNNLFDDKNREKIVILLTDGDTNKGFDPYFAAQYLADNNIKIYSVGIGGKDGGYIYALNQEFKILPLNENILKDISNIGKGESYIASDGKILEKIFSDLSKLQTSEIEYEKIVLFKNFDNKILNFLLILIFFILLFNLFRININNND